MSWVAMPYMTSRRFCQTDFLGGVVVIGTPSSGRGSQAVQVVIVFVGEFSLAQDPPFPGGDVGDDVGQQPEVVVGRQDRDAEDVAKGGQHEQTLDAGAHLQGMLGQLVAHHPEQEVAHGAQGALHRPGVFAGGARRLGARPRGGHRRRLIVAQSALTVEEPRARMTAGRGNAMDPVRFQPWLLVLVFLVMGWFAVGVIWNIRRGNAILRWMQGGLPKLGEKTTLRWLGTSVVELSIQKAKAPFRQVQVMLVMTPRDVPWLWLLAAGRGRKDTLIFRGPLATAPRLGDEVASAGSWTGQRSITEARHRRWGEEPDGDHLFLAPTASLAVSRPGARA